MHVSLSVRGILSFFLGQIDIGAFKNKQHHISLLYQTRHFLSRARCQQSSSIMEQAVVSPATLAELNESVSVEKPTPTGAPETGKRKSDEPDQPETSGRGKRRRGGGGKKLGPGERYIPPPQKRNPVVGFTQEHFNETSYYFEGGLRKVFPYYFDFKTYCKGRWVGKTLLDVFNSEFRAESIEYYQRAAKEGRIRLNETPVEDLSVVLRVGVIKISRVMIMSVQQDTLLFNNVTKV